MAAPETLVEKQVRLVLEQQCSAVFDRVLLPEHRLGFEVTLVVAEYGLRGNVAFKTSLHVEALLGTLSALLRAWERGGPREITADDARGVRLMSRLDLERLQLALRDASPAGVGFSLLVGRGRAVQYVSSMDRAGATDLLGGLFRNLAAEARGS